ncbi:uncharacterized protein LOC125658195 [Ostrea edulis]|uniref:uncharacterized protein LOC125658195 n=1 Tax=Ostrea edulis TaxID=37623 RepID=UPI0020946DFA|nr:uncharacterized protein LOC125658195 [Ostrea edulis]
MMGECSWTCNITEDFVLDRVLTSVTPAEVLEGDDDKEEESVHADDIDGLSCIPFPKNRDSSTSTSSNSSSDSDDFISTKNRRARNFQSLWSRDTMFSLQSAKHPRNHDDVYHVVTQVYSAAQNEIRVNDRIIEINEKDVRRKSMQEIDIIWKGLAKASKIKLKVWRWKCDGVGHIVRELKIVFHRVRPDCPIREISRLALSDKIPRAVKNFVWTSDDFIPYHIRIASESGIYFFANSENMTLYGESMKEKAGNNQFRFLVRFFSCIIEDDVHGCNARVGFVVQYGKDFDVSSVLPESTSVLLKRHVPYDTKKLDERFILKLQIPKEEDFFESLSYKNMFMKYDNESKEIRMQQMDGPGPSYLYEMFETRGPKSTAKFDIPTVSEIAGNLFVLEQIKE